MPTPTALTLKRCASVLVAPKETSHKYTRGVLGLVTGSDTYPGAALMSARAAVNTGAGLVRFVGSEALAFKVQLAVPETVCSSFTEPSAVRVDAWGLGSGLHGQTRERQVTQVLETGAAAIVDAGAVPLAARLVTDGLKLGPHQIMTPHAGELTEALAWLVALAPHALPGLKEPPERRDVEESPAEYALIAARALGATMLLKGGVTTVASPCGELLSVGGNTPWLATAGSGDTLTGVLGALLAGYRARSSAHGGRETDYAYLAGAGALVHGLAAELVHEGGPRGPVPPTLVAQKLPAAMGIAVSQVTR